MLAASAATSPRASFLFGAAVGIAVTVVLTSVSSRAGGAGGNNTSLGTGGSGGSFQGGVGCPQCPACSVVPGPAPAVDGAQRVFNEFALTSASKEVHCFSWMYGELLGRFHCKGSLQHNLAHGEPLRLLEIGFGVGEPTEGSSTQLWRKMFPGAQVHIMEKMDSPLLAPYSQKYAFTLHMGDQTNLTSLAAVAAAVPGGFDIVIDDGGHTQQQQLTSMTGLWPHVRPGGLYIVEDVETSYYPEYGGGDVDATGTFLASVKSMVDVLNLPFSRRSFPQPGPRLRFPDDEQLASVKCYRNLCAFQKKYGNEHLASGCLSGHTPDVPNPRPEFPSAARCAVDAW